MTAPKLDHQVSFNRLLNDEGFEGELKESGALEFVCKRMAAAGQPPLRGALISHMKRWVCFRLEPGRKRAGGTRLQPA